MNFSFFFVSFGNLYGKIELSIVLFLFSHLDFDDCFSTEIWLERWLPVNHQLTWDNYHLLVDDKDAENTEICRVTQNASIYCLCMFVCRRKCKRKMPIMRWYMERI